MYAEIGEETCVLVGIETPSGVRNWAVIISSPVRRRISDTGEKINREMFCIT